MKKGDFLIGILAVILIFLLMVSLITFFVAIAPALEEIMDSIQKHIKNIHENKTSPEQAFLDKIIPIIKKFIS